MCTLLFIHCSQRNKAIDELTARSLKHTRVMTNKLTSNGTKPYFGPVDQQTRIVEKIREQVRWACWIRIFDMCGYIKGDI